jgi:hypothetical protein
MAGQTMGCVAPQIERAKDVHRANSDMLDALAALEISVSELADRLTPVLSAPYPKPAAEDGKTAACYTASLACDIQSTGYRIRSMADHVRDLIARLEV